VEWLASGRPVPRGGGLRVVPGAGRVSGVRGELAVLRRRPGPAVRGVGRVAVPGLPVRCCAAPDYPATTTSQEGQGGRLGRAAHDARATDAGRPRAGPLSMPGAARRRLPTVKATGLHACCTVDRRERRRPPARAHEHSPARHTHTLWTTHGKACEGWFVLSETCLKRGRTPCGRPEQAPSGSARPQAKPQRAAQAQGPWRGSRGIRLDPLYLKGTPSCPTHPADGAEPAATPLQDPSMAAWCGRRTAAASF